MKTRTFIDLLSIRQSTDGDSSLQLQVLCWELNHDKGSGNSRLFGASLRGFIFEVRFDCHVNRNCCRFKVYFVAAMLKVDLKQLRIQGIQESYGGAVWSMACCPYDSLLAVSCEDGTVRIFRFDAIYFKNYIFFNKPKLNLSVDMVTIPERS